MNFALKMMNLALQMMNFVFKMMDLMQTSRTAPHSGFHLKSKSDEFCVPNDELFWLKMMNFALQNDEFCVTK